MQLFGEYQVLAHRTHPVGERADDREHRLPFQIGHNVMAIMDRLDVAERLIEERSEVILLVPRGQRSEDLVQVQVSEELRLWVTLDDR